ncbi:MAG: nuclear transport factor 2 family protein [Cyclobacteriaceae bacterium]
METLTKNRKDLLHQIARDYVEEGLNKGNLENLPYHPNMELRAPLLPGGSTVPVKGRKKILEFLGKVLEIVENAELVDSYVNEDLTAATVEFYCKIKDPKTKLRIIDRFRVNEAGQVTDQENFYDPRDISHPGWQK